MHSMPIEDGRYNKVAKYCRKYQVKYHPHGDVITDAMGAIGQKNCSLDTQGNWEMFIRDLQLQPDILKQD